MAGPGCAELSSAQNTADALICCISFRANGDEASFPRGGASALTPLEYRQVRREAEESVLYGDDEVDDVDDKVVCSHG
jgi:hypothetical protein